MPETTAQEHMVEMAKKPTLDEFFLRNPKDQSDKDLMRLIDIEQQDRAIFIVKGDRVREEKTDE